MERRRLPFAAVLLSCIAFAPSCDSDSTGPDRDPEGALVFFGHPSDPLMARARADNGITVEAYGDKNPDGSIRAVRTLVVSGLPQAMWDNGGGAVQQEGTAEPGTGLIALDPKPSKGTRPTALRRFDQGHSRRGKILRSRVNDCETDSSSWRFLRKTSCGAVTRVHNSL